MKNNTPRQIGEVSVDNGVRAVRLANPVDLWTDYVPPAARNAARRLEYVAAKTAANDDNAVSIPAPRASETRAVPLTARDILRGTIARSEPVGHWASSSTASVPNRPRKFKR